MNQTTVSRPELRADVGVIGGSGFYSFLAEVQPVTVGTPFGPPSDDLVIGVVGDHTVAFLARHGQGHRIPPHRIDYRANLWALRAVGVRQVLAPCAVGSLDPEQGPGTVVIPDQIIDRTWGRAHTVFDLQFDREFDDEFDDVDAGEGAAAGAVVHASFADPYCPIGRDVASEAARAAGVALSAHGTLVVINGPRFSTRAEAAANRQAGGTIVGMTGMPEAIVARELAMCYTALAMVTDLDAGVGPDDAVTHARVLEMFAANMPAFKALVHATVQALPADPGDSAATCRCRRALDGNPLPFALPS